MLEVKSHINVLKHIVLVWLILFSLAPCSVKEVFADVLYSSQKPLNKTKTAFFAAGCQFSTLVSRKNSVSHQHEANRTLEPILFLGNRKSESGSTALFEEFGEIYSGNSPPKYILYKRLKVNAA